VQVWAEGDAAIKAVWKIANSLSVSPMAIEKDNCRVLSRERRTGRPEICRRLRGGMRWVQIGTADRDIDDNPGTADGGVLGSLQSGFNVHGQDGST
jgi:hypothetical protein